MNDSPDNPEKTRRDPDGRVEHWNYRQNAGATGASGSSVRKDRLDGLKRTHQEPAEGIAGGRTLVETMARTENTGTTRAAGVRMKWQGDGTGGSPVYIKFSHNA